MEEIKLGHLTITPTSKPVFIFEAGINHNGDINLAYKLITEAYKVGAQVVKFQLHLPESEMMPSHPLWQVLSETALNINIMKRLKAHAELLGLVFLCTPFCIPAVDQLESIGVLGYKMGSGELNNIPMQVHVAKKGKPMIISTGMSSIEEVNTTFRAISPYNKQIVFMNCASTYPATSRQSRLQRITLMKELYRGHAMIGQSDHTPTISTCLGAIARAALVIEKHVTLDRGMNGPDHAASITPEEFGQMVVMGNEIWEGMQASREELYWMMEEEQKVRGWANHSLVTTVHLEEGQRIEEWQLTTKRPADGGIPASRYYDVLGRSAMRYLEAGHQLQPMDYGY